MKGVSFSSLRVRSILLVLIAIIPAWALTLYTTFDQRRLAALDFQEHARRLANLAAHEEGRLIEGSRQILIALDAFLRMHHGDPGRCNALFVDLLRRCRRYANFGAARANGDVFCSAIHLTRPANVANRGWFQRAVQTREFAVGDYQNERITAEAVFVAAYPVLDEGGQILAVVFAAFNLEWLNRFAFDVEAQLPKGSTLVQMDRRGVILAHYPDPEKWIGKPIPERNLIKTVARKEKGFVESPDADGIPWLYAFAPVTTSVKGRDSYLILGISKQTAFASANRILTRNLGYLGLVAVLALIAAWFGTGLFILQKIKALLNVAKRLALGDSSARTGLTYGGGELNQLAKAFDEMAAALEHHEVGRQQMEEQLRRSHEQLRNLSTHLQTATEEERARIAREIHDDLGQALTALKMDLSWLSNRLPSIGRPMLRKIESMSSLIDENIQTVQKLSAELRPGILDDFGLPAAIEWQAEEFQDRTGVKCTVAVEPEEIDLGKEQSTAVFRIFQETLTNVIRHANATEVEVTLKEKDGKVILEVKDNGVGIPEGRILDPKSFGLIGMRERVHPWGGKVDIVGAEGKGTKVTVFIPLGT